MKRLIIVSALAATALGAAAPALAHTHLIKSDPKAGAVLHTGPKSITLTFSERVVPAFSHFTLSMSAHHMAVPIRTVVAPDGKRIVGTLTAPLSAGGYAVAWTAASADGHKMSGMLNFKVG